MRTIGPLPSCNELTLHLDRRNAAFAAGLVIIPLVGPLGGGVAAGVYLKKAADKAERIENTKRFIQGHMAAIDAANAVIACLHVIEVRAEPAPSIDSD